MPNWCSTNIDICFSTESEALMFNALLDSWMSVSAKSDFGASWLGNILINAGIATVGEDGRIVSDYRCRGSVAWSELDDTVVHIQTETAWCPMLSMWVAILEKYAPDASITYTAEECGCCMYVSNDDSVVGLYNIDSCNDSVDSAWLVSFDCVKGVIREVLNIDYTKDTLSDDILESLRDNDIYINQYEYAEISDFD